MTKISKIIWQTHEWDYSDLPVNFKRASMTWKNLNPGWEYKYVNAAERAEQVKAYSEEAYLFYRFADKTTQADLWRYIALLNNGGVYADMDSICSVPLDYALRNVHPRTQVIATPFDENNKVNNANFACVKNSGTLEKLIVEILNQYREIPLISIMEQMSYGHSFEDSIADQLFTGPDVYSSVVLASDDVWLEYDGAIHTRDIKNHLDYMPQYIVDYYGDPTPYLDLVEKHGWSLT